jgi:hypothetical protein
LESGVCMALAHTHYYLLLTHNRKASHTLQRAYWRCPISGSSGTASRKKNKTVQHVCALAVLLAATRPFLGPRSVRARRPYARRSRRAFPMPWAPRSATFDNATIQRLYCFVCPRPHDASIQKCRVWSEFYRPRGTCLTAPGGCPYPTGWVGHWNHPHPPQ